MASRPKIYKKPKNRGLRKGKSQLNYETLQVQLALSSLGEGEGEELSNLVRKALTSLNTLLIQVSS
jgi:hypothetical protein